MVAQRQDSIGTVLLIGGTGYVGEHLRESLRDAGYAVRLLVRSRNSASVLETLGFETVEGDITSPSSLVDPFTGVDAVINLVAIIKERGEATFEQINYQGSVNVADAARQSGVRRLIQMSAIGAGDRPDLPYLYTKWKAENYIRDSQLEWTIIRPSIIFGPSPGNKFQFVTQLADVVRKAPVTPVVGDGSALFQPIHLDDVSSVFTRALDDYSMINETYEIGGPAPMTYEEIIDQIQITLGKRRRKVHVNASLMAGAAGIMGFLPVIDPPVTRQQVKMLKLDNVPRENAATSLVDRPLTPLPGNIDYIRG